MLASVLEERGFAVKILEMAALHLSESDIEPIIDREKPDIVGISAMTSTVNSALNVVQRIKEINNRICVVLGGAHVSVLPEETLLRNPDVDIIVRGEGEKTMPELIDVVASKNEDLANVLGITYRTEEGVKSNPPRPYIDDLDSLPFPAFNLLPKGKYHLHPPFGRKSPAMPIITSRGCPYSCIFCSKSVFGNKYRSNSPGYVIKQIQFLIEKFGIREIKFYDDVFTLDKKRVMSICSELKNSRIDIPWTCETRVNLVDKALLSTMKDAGCYMIAYGVESGSQEILNVIDKKTTLEQITRAFNLTHRIGINTVGYFMIGTPNETSETIRETIEFAKRIDPDFVQFSIATPYPGTKLYEVAARDGSMSRRWDNYVYAEIESLHSPDFPLSNVSGQELKEWNREAYRSFYLRWKYVWKRLKKLKSIDEAKTDAIGLRMLLDIISQ
jgi:radical SAM superfamily enzyme YgiQ (UPF0313 family)